MASKPKSGHRSLDDVAPEFKVFISQRTNPDRIEADLPREVALQFMQEYEDVFKADTASITKGIVQYGAQALFDSQATLNFNHPRFFVWLGGNPISFTLDLMFVSEKREDEAQRKIAALIKMASPTNGVDVGFGTDFTYLNTPVGKDNPISVQIGKYLAFDDVLITHVAPTFNKPLLKGGWSSRIGCNVTFQTQFAVTQDKIDSMFKLK